MTEFWQIFAVVAIAGILVSIFLDRLLNPWLRKRSFAKFSKDFNEGKIKLRHFDSTVLFDEIGFGVKSNGSIEQPSRMLWNEVVKAIAYKRDLFSTDRVCVFLSRANQTGLEVHEEMNNWNDFITSLPKHLSGCKPVELWLQQITVPAFATNLTELFVRQNDLAKQEVGK